ncbi:MAG: serine hydrolase domain-containing protein, partial [Bacteroidota bacterium]
MHKAFYLTFSICFIFLSNLQGSNKDSIDLFLQKQFQAGKLNGNVLIVKNGTTVYENSFGFTDGTRKEPLSKQHKFIIGSIYKEFPAVTILQLVELEQLKLSDKLNEHLLDLPSWANEITITHFLQYSSGLPKVNWNKYFSNNIMLTEELLYEDIQQIDSLAFTPGSDYLYSNMGPILLTKVVESVTGIPFKGYVQKHILDRYGLFGIKFKEQYPYKYPSLMAIPFNTDSQADSYNIAVPGL